MLLDDLVGVIETLKQRIQAHGATLRANEIRTRVALIDPLLTALGWDVSDPALVTPEYTVGEGRADYALHGSESIPAAIVEAKRLGHALNDDERMQMLNYANARGVRYAAVTDGDVWEFYEVFRQAPLDCQHTRPRTSVETVAALAAQRGIRAAGGSKGSAVRCGVHYPADKAGVGLTGRFAGH
ncbi:MAG: type I restriction enzyme HsdR N-terminal domain-containing protein [Dehalococcoidia bacterium]|nr:type I restriction enzyme HsdR N-terminal domain-containing protein [Dehalococcoidia bacterium]